MKITTQEQVNVLVWTIALILFGCMLINFLTDAEIISAITGLVFIGSLCLFYVVRRSEPGQQVFSQHMPQKLLPRKQIFAMGLPVSSRPSGYRLGFEDWQIFAYRIRKSATSVNFSSTIAE